LNKLLILISMFVLVGCNAYIGIPKEHTEQPWYFIFWFTFIISVLLPFFSTWFALKASKADVLYKTKVQKYLNYSIIFLIVLCILHEMSLTPRTNIRLDLFLLIPCILIQMIAVFIAWYNLQTEKTTKKPLK